MRQFSNLAPNAWQIVVKPLEKYLTERGVKILQIKEKLDELRCYYDGSEATISVEAIDAIIEFAAYACYCIDYPERMKGEEND